MWCGNVVYIADKMGFVVGAIEKNQMWSNGAATIDEWWETNDQKNSYEYIRPLVWGRSTAMRESMVVSNMYTVCKVGGGGYK